MLKSSNYDYMYILYLQKMKFWSYWNTINYYTRLGTQNLEYWQFIIIYEML